MNKVYGANGIVYNHYPNSGGSVETGVSTGALRDWAVQAELGK